MSGFVVWLTGLSGAGKSTLASMLTQELTERGVHVECLDGDEVRKNLSDGLGFSRDDRDRNVRRIGYVARMVARSGACSITAAISPYRALRDEIRSKTENFLEVYCECPIDVLTERDPKGLYKRALAGELKNFTGVDDPYEAPDNAEVHLRTDLSTPEECLQKIVAKLEARGLLNASRGVGAPLPPPYGGEVFEARTARQDEFSDLERVEVDQVTLENVIAVAQGYFSPVAAFMTQREAVKVAKNAALEGGTPWWRIPFVLSVPKALGACEGMRLALTHEGDPFAIVRIEQVYEIVEGQPRVAGPIEAIAAARRTGPSAREVRARARQAGAGHLSLVLSHQQPSAGLVARLHAVEAVSHAAALAVPLHLVEAWRSKLGDRTFLLGLPRDFPFEDQRAQLVIQKSLGASARLSLREE